MSMVPKEQQDIQLNYTEMTVVDFMALVRMQPVKILRGGEGGFRPFKFRKHDFDLWIGGDGLDMYQQI